MRAISAAKLDSLADYAEIAIAAPEPGPGQVRIRVVSVGIGYVDALVALGRYQVKPPLPHIPGSEIAGTIDAMGMDAGTWQVGDRVFAITIHAFAELALAPVAACRRAPHHIELAAAAAVPLNYLTALHGLADRGRLQPGETLLVLGAAGGVGSAAIQVGKALGARVIAAASTPEKRAFALQQGADGVIDTEVDGWRDRLKSLLAGATLNVILATSATMPPWRASSPRSRPSGSRATFTVRAITPKPKCSTTSNASTIRPAVTRPWAISAPWTSRSKRL